MKDKAPSSSATKPNWWFTKAPDLISFRAFTPPSQLAYTPLYGLSKYHMDTQLLGGLALAGAADFGSSTYSGGPTHTELVLTTSATTVEQFLTRKTDVYYIEDVDHGLFEKNEFKQMKVVNQ